MKIANNLPLNDSEEGKSEKLYNVNHRPLAATTPTFVLPMPEEETDEFPGFEFPDSMARSSKEMVTKKGDMEMPMVTSVAKTCPVKLVMDFTSAIMKTGADYLSKIKELDPHNNSPKYSRSDIGSAQLFADVVEGQVCFVPDVKSYYVYNGIRWEPDKGNLQTMEMCKMVGKALAVYANTIKDEDQRAVYKAFVRKWTARGFRKTVLDDAAGVRTISLGEFDANPYLLNCQNGTLDLKKMEFRPHNPNDKITKVANVIYNSDAICQRFKDFISEIMDGNENKSAFLQKVLAYALSGDCRYECMFIFFGKTTRNGKSTLMESVRNMMGSYGLTANPEMFAEKRRDSQAPSEDLARLVGCRLGNVSEPSKELRFNAALIKSLTGNDTINARFLRANSFEFRPQIKFYVGTNCLPQINDRSVFQSNRIYVLTFDRSFAPEERDNSLKQKFGSEEAKSAILNWLIDGWEALGKEGLMPPIEVITATEEYRRDCDKIACFMADELMPEADAKVKMTDVYKRYTRWCRDESVVAMRYNTFKNDLEDHLVEPYCIDHQRPSDGSHKTTVLVGYRLK